MLNFMEIDVFLSFDYSFVMGPLLFQSKIHIDLIVVYAHGYLLTTIMIIIFVVSVIKGIELSFDNNSWKKWFQLSGFINVFTLFLMQESCAISAMRTSIITTSIYLLGFNRQQFQLNMDNLKAQTQSVLTKVLQQMSKQKQEDQKNQLANPQSQVVPVTCKQLIELYSHNMQAREKMLLQVALASDLSEQMNTVSFRQKISKTLQQINLQHNQFNIPQSQLPPSLMNKTSKQKKQTPKKKTEPTVDSNPQYFRVDHEICNKLFMHYKSLPLGTPSVGGFNFEQKQHHKNSMNYHKILEIFKDAKIELEINQKLLILRSIKKFSFNQNFISGEEFLKVFKVIVHGLGFKEQIFQQFIKRSSIQKQYNAIKNKNSIQKPRRNYRFKTDNSALQHKTTLNTSKLVMQPIALQNKRVVTDKNEKKVISNKNIPKTQANNVSYLAKAMEGQKISKISWDSLFNMKQSNMHSFIVIPDFVRNVQVEDF